MAVVEKMSRKIFKSVIPPSHQHVFTQAYSFGTHSENSLFWQAFIWPAKHYPSQVHCQSHDPGKGSSSFMTLLQCALVSILWASLGLHTYLSLY